MNKETNIIGIDFDPMQIEHISQLFGHELALSLKNAMQEEALTVNVNLYLDDNQVLERIATAFEKIEEKLCK